MSFRSLHGLALESPPWSTIGSAEWPLKNTVLQSWFLANLFTDRALVAAPRLQMNLLKRLSPGLAIQIHGRAQRGRRVKDWPSSLHIVGPY
jgi:hypothetical protein